MKNTLIKKLNTLKPFILVAILFTGVAIVAGANVWKDPSYYTYGSKAPINEGAASQVKDGVLTVATLVNTAFKPIVTYSPLSVGNSGGSDPVKADTSFYGKLNIFNIVDPNVNVDMPLCTGEAGKVKLCSDGVIFEALQNKYYTETNTVTFPTSVGVHGYVKYTIDASLSCTPKVTSGTTWGSDTTPLTGTDDSYTVIFYDWGRYTLTMKCTNDKEYSVVIDIKGKIKPTAYNQVQKFQFPSSRTLEVMAQGGGASAGGWYYSNKNKYDPNEKICVSGSAGLSAYTHITGASSWSPKSTSSTNKGANYDSGANVAHAGGGDSLDSNYILMSDGGCVGEGGGYTTNNMSSVVSRNGGRTSTTAPGKPGSGLGLGTDGTGAEGVLASSPVTTKRGGGGGAYVSGLYNITANNYIYVYNGGGVGQQGVSGSAKPASMIIEWK